MGSLRRILRGYLGDIWGYGVVVGSLWGRKAIRRDVGCHRTIWGHKGGRQGGYRGDMGLLWGY